MQDMYTTHTKLCMCKCLAFCRLLCSLTHCGFIFLPTKQELSLFIIKHYLPPPMYVFDTLVTGVVPPGKTGSPPARGLGSQTTPGSLGGQLITTMIGNMSKIKNRNTDILSNRVFINISIFKAF